MQHNDQTRATLLAIGSVLDQMRPSAFSRNFEDLANLVRLGLWEPEPPRGMGYVLTMHFEPDLPDAGKTLTGAANRVSYLRH
jgi:hypothetical protein